MRSQVVESPKQYRNPFYDIAERWSLRVCVSNFRDRPSLPFQHAGSIVSSLLVLESCEKVDRHLEKPIISCNLKDNCKKKIFSLKEHILNRKNLL